MNKQGPDGIRWTNFTWNPATGCSVISAACFNCYALKYSADKSVINAKTAQMRKIKNECLAVSGWSNGKPQEDTQKDEYIRDARGNFLGANDKETKPIWKGVSLHDKRLRDPLKVKEPSKVFVVSMGDLFHKDVPDAFIIEIFRTIQEAFWHDFQILTKRADRMAHFANNILPDVMPWPENAWAGVTLESTDTKRPGVTQAVVDRVKHLLTVQAPIRWLSIEPMKGPVNLPDATWKQLSWGVVGGESDNFAGPDGMGYGPVVKMEDTWAEDVLSQMTRNGVAAFYKQRGAFDLTGKFVGGHGVDVVAGNRLVKYPAFYLKRLKGE